MKTFAATLATLSILATTSFAASMADFDTDADGMLSPEEFATAFADLDSSVFVEVDANADGMIDEEEFQAASTEDGPLVAG